MVLHAEKDIAQGSAKPKTGKDISSCAVEGLTNDVDHLKQITRAVDSSNKGRKEAIEASLGYVFRRPSL